MEEDDARKGAGEEEQEPLVSNPAKQSSDTKRSVTLVMPDKSNSGSSSSSNSGSSYSSGSGSGSSSSDGGGSKSEETDEKMKCFDEKKMVMKCSPADRHPPLGPLILMLMFQCLPMINLLIVVPSLPSHLKNLGTSEGFAGWVVAVFPAAMAISLIGSLVPMYFLFGVIQSYRKMVRIGCAGSLIACVMYGFSVIIPSVYLVLGSRFLSGSCCYLALCKTYVALTTGRNNRSLYFSIVGTVILSDTVLAFSFASLIDWIADDWGNKLINRYTAVQWWMFMLWSAYWIAFEMLKKNAKIRSKIVIF